MEIEDLVEDRIIFLPEPVRFNVDVGGQKRAAEFMWAQYVGEGEYHFKIKFSDGHEDLYELNNSEVYNHQKEIDAYATALMNEIYMPLWAWEPEDKIHVLLHPVTGENLWIVLHKGGPYYSVYLHNDLVFHPDKETGEKLGKMSGKTIDGDLLLEIFKNL